MDSDYFDVDAICKKHEKFIEDVLVPKLIDTRKKRDEMKDEMLEYDKLKLAIDEISEKQENFETLVNIDENILVQATVNDPNDNIYIHIGFGIHVDMDRESCLQFITKRKQILQRRVDFLVASEQKITSDVHEVMLH
jgi:prefoldin alpha subunit